MIPPASRSRSGSLVRGSRGAILIKPSRPSRIALQPITCRPMGPLRSGWQQSTPGHECQQDGCQVAQGAMVLATPVVIACQSHRQSPPDRRPNGNRAAEEKQSDRLAVELGPLPSPQVPIVAPHYSRLSEADHGAADTE